MSSHHTKLTQHAKANNSCKRDLPDDKEVDGVCPCTYPECPNKKYGDTSCSTGKVIEHYLSQYTVRKYHCTACTASKCWELTMIANEIKVSHSSLAYYKAKVAEAEKLLSQLRSKEVELKCTARSQRGAWPSASMKVTDM